jgi:hypothetical protein
MFSFVVKAKLPMVYFVTPPCISRLSQRDTRVSRVFSLERTHRLIFHKHPARGVMKIRQIPHQVHAIRERANKRIEAVLNPDQLTTFRQVFEQPQQQPQKQG